jgi:hypothetical protein
VHDGDKAQYCHDIHGNYVTIFVVCLSLADHRPSREYEESKDDVTKNLWVSVNVVWYLWYDTNCFANLQVDIVLVSKDNRLVLKEKGSVHYNWIR